MKRSMHAALLSALAWLLAGCQPSEPRWLGSLEWERIALRAPVAERIERIDVREGDRVDAGTPIVQLDDRVLVARHAAALAEQARAEARLDELLAGARDDRIRAARARERKASSAAELAATERTRITALVARGLLPRAERDRVVAADQAATAERAAAAADLADLLAGSRNEELAQARAAIAAARAQVDAAALGVERLRIVAPRAGVIESLPFEPGDDPPAGAVLATLQIGDAPYARLYVPQARRMQVAVGDPVDVHVDGVGTLRGRVRVLAVEPSFTPYFALTGDDVDRLVYLAEVELGAEAARLPAGIAVSASLPAP